MGIYRLLLVFLVAISHAGITFCGYFTGASAVISFYILSGHSMSILIKKYYMKKSAIPTFYLERITRIFPQYIFYMLLASAVIYFLKVDTTNWTNINKLTFGKWLLNFLILPQSLTFYFIDGNYVIPQSWMLGLEITFYLAIPWILLYFSDRQIYGLAFASFLVFLAAYLGKINTDVFGYRVLPGTLFMFLVGWSFFKNDSDSRKFRIAVLLIAGTLLLIAFLNKPLYRLPYNKEVLVGLMIGILAISFINRISKFSNVDKFFGNLTYGVFLNHWMIIWVMQKLFGVEKFDTLNITILLTSSCALALFSYYYIERPALKWRHIIRSRAIARKRNQAVESDALGVQDA